MSYNFLFFFNSALLGLGLAMDAFSVSMANGLNEPKMRGGKMCAVAGVFAFFQALMPLLGRLCVCTVAQWFHWFEILIPWIAMLLLAFIGGKMLLDGILHKDEAEEASGVGVAALLLQGAATSIDALSVGFTLAEYDWLGALFASLIIAAVTFIVCLGGVWIGKRFGTRLSNKAQIFGGLILIFIGLEIFITGIF